MADSKDATRTTRTADLLQSGDAVHVALRDGADWCDGDIVALDMLGITLDAPRGRGLRVVRFFPWASVHSVELRDAA